MGRETYTGDVAFEVRGHLGIITLNRPEAMNALTELMCESVHIQLLQWAEDDDVAQVLVRGAGDRGLCAGGDVVGVHRDMVAHQPEDGGPLLPEGTPAYQADFASEGFWRAEYRMNLAIAEYPKPYIAFMDGLVLGGGVGISAHGSHRIVTERSRVGMPETTIGYSPDIGGTHLLSRAPDALGMYAGLLGAHLGAADAIRTGLADVCLDSSSAEELVARLAEDHVDAVLEELTVDPGPAPLQEHVAWIRQVFSAPEVEQILAELEARASETPEAGTMAETLRSRSPISLKVTHRAISTAAELDLRGALTQEYTVGVHMLRSHDFREGIRAQLIDKDRAPAWVLSSLGEVDEELVDHYFTPVPHRVLRLEAS